MLLEPEGRATRLTCSTVTVILEPGGRAMRLTCLAVTMILEPGVELRDLPV